MNWMDFFVGEWRVERTVADARAGAEGRFLGVARFAPTKKDRLDYSEIGLMRYRGVEVQAQQRFEWRFRENALLDVADRSGAVLCRLDLANLPAAARHHCREDEYDVSLFVDATDEEKGWRQIWKVRGPRKNYESDSLYARLGDVDHAATL